MDVKHNFTIQPAAGNTQDNPSRELNLRLNIVMQLKKACIEQTIFFNSKNIIARIMPKPDRIVLKMKTLHENTS